MRYTNLKCAMLVLAIFPLAVTACKAPVAETPSSLDSAIYLDDRPLCGLTAPDEDSPWRHVWRADYDPGGVSDLIRDGDWLWVTTPVDIVRLNLRTLDCTRFGLSGTRRLLLDPDGRLWAAGGLELAHFDGQHWRSFSFGRSSAGRPACDLALDKRGNLWVLSCSCRPGDGVWFRYPGHEPPEDGLWEGELVYNAPSDENDCDQWFSRGGEFRSPEECRLLADWRRRLASLAPPEGIAPWGENQPIAAETRDRLWMLARRLPDDPKPYDTLLSFDGQNWQVLPWPYGSARLVADETRGGVWAGTGEGLVFSDGRSIQKYLLLPGDAVPVGPKVYDLVVDGNGRLWASTERGLLLYDEALNAWQPTEVVGHPLISADDRGGLWAVPRGRSGQVSYLDGETWTHRPFPGRWPCYPESILADAGGGLWLSSYDCALRGFDGEVWDEYDNGSRGDMLARGPDGAVYAAGWGGIGAIRRYDGDTWETLLPDDPSRRARVIDLVVGPEGEAWATFDAPPKLIVYRDGEWEQVPGVVDEAITALLVDSQGDLWAGHSASLLHYDGETWERIERETPFSAINALAEDRQGRIWVGGRDGLSVYDSTGK